MFHSQYDNNYWSLTTENPRKSYFITKKNVYLQALDSRTTWGPTFRSPVMFLKMNIFSSFCTQHTQCKRPNVIIDYALREREKKFTRPNRENRFFLTFIRVFWHKIQTTGEYLFYFILFFWTVHINVFFVWLREFPARTTTRATSSERVP